MSAHGRSGTTATGPVQVKAAGWATAGERLDIAPAPTKRRNESNVDFGRRAIATAVLAGDGCLRITWPGPDHELSCWLRGQVIALSTYVNSLPQRTYCGCTTCEGEVVTALLHTWLTPGHLCDTDCSWTTTDSWVCAGQAWIDCQRCARADIAPILGIGSTCDRCQQETEYNDFGFVAASCGDVLVVARLCPRCLRGEGLTREANGPP